LFFQEKMSSSEMLTPQHSSPSNFSTPVDSPQTTPASSIFSTPADSPPTTPPPALDFTDIVICAGPCDSWDDVTKMERGATQFMFCFENSRQTWVFTNGQQKVTVINALICRGCWNFENQVFDFIPVTSIYRRYLTAVHNKLFKSNMEITA
jgi:hypothetical protein